MLTDFHSHILPGIDDGSRSTEESIAMLQQEREQGISTVIATPHFYARHDTPDKFLNRRAEAFQRLQEALAQHDGLPAVELAAEVHYFSGMSDSEALSGLTIAGSKYLLVEMPSSAWTEPMYREIEGIYDKLGLTPVIAHVDRYIRPFNTHKIPERLAQLPVLVQANASFFVDRGTQRMALRMVRDGMIHLIGSDCHNLTDRAPNMGGAIKIIQRRFGDEMIQRIQSCEASVLR